MVLHLHDLPVPSAICLHFHLEPHATTDLLIVHNLLFLEISYEWTHRICYVGVGLF